MKNILKYFSFSLLLICISCNSKGEKPLKDKRQVYLCKSAMAYSYHFDVNCLGLKNCDHDILKTTVTLAKKQGRRFCRLEINDSIA